MKYICDEEGRILRDRGLVLERWACFFDTLLNPKFGKLRPNNIARLSQRPVTLASGAELTGNELTTTLRSIANAKAARTVELPVKLIAIGYEATVFREFPRVVKVMCHLQKYRSGGNMP